MVLILVLMNPSCMKNIGSFFWLRWLQSLFSKRAEQPTTLSWPTAFLCAPCFHSARRRLHFYGSNSACLHLMGPKSPPWRNKDFQVACSQEGKPIRGKKTDMQSTWRTSRQTGISFMLGFMPVRVAWRDDVRCNGGCVNYTDFLSMYIHTKHMKQSTFTFPACTMRKKVTQFGLSRNTLSFWSQVKFSVSMSTFSPRLLHGSCFLVFTVFRDSLFW